MAFSFVQTQLPGVIEILPDRFGDDRGYFSEVYNQLDFESQGIEVAWVQDNQSLSVQQGVLRGLHFQRPPRAQDKLVRVIRGAVLDVAVDIRRGSPSFSKWVSRVLSAEEGNQLFVPRGFAHGFVTLEPNTEVLYKVSDRYSPEHDAAIRYDDPDIGVDWRLDGAMPNLSPRDAGARLLKEQDTGFVYQTEDPRA